jgi:nucleotide-binding universal stress UspA family protein
MSHAVDLYQYRLVAQLSYWDGLSLSRRRLMYKRILVPVDGSPTATKAITAALQLARMGGGRVRLVYVLEEMVFLTDYQFGSGSADLAKIMRDSGVKVLSDAMAMAQSAGVEADQVLLDSRPGRLGETVADAAKLWDADLIVAGTHGRHGVERFFMGSGAEQIIRMAPVHVLAVRDPSAS